VAILVKTMTAALFAERLFVVDPEVVSKDLEAVSKDQEVVLKDQREKRAVKLSVVAREVSEAWVVPVCWQVADVEKDLHSKLSEAEAVVKQCHL
jgi:hypothetical protein